MFQILGNQQRDLKKKKANNQTMAHRTNQPQRCPFLGKSTILTNLEIKKHS